MPGEWLAPHLSREESRRAKINVPYATKSILWPWCICAGIPVPCRDSVCPLAGRKFRELPGGCNPLLTIRGPVSTRPCR